MEGIANRLDLNVSISLKGPTSKQKLFDPAHMKNG